MIWYWYVARPNELFIDMDRYDTAIKHCRRRLAGAMEHGKLDVESVFDCESSPGHHHVIITLKSPMRDMQRFAWEMILHSDIYRAACNIMRADNLIPSPDILISRRLLHRYANMTCNCKSKHTREAMKNCQAAISLRGEFRDAAFFGPKSAQPSDLL